MAPPHLFGNPVVSLCPAPAAPGSLFLDSDTRVSGSWNMDNIPDSFSSSDESGGVQVTETLLT